MEAKYKTHLILGVILLLISPAFSPGADLWANEDSKYLDAVREFADNVLKYGRDTYGKHTPLFVDGLMVRDPNNPDYGKDGVYKPVEWISPEGERWILSNLASQQNLFRTLDGLTTITGDPKYKQAAMDAIKYAFENLRSPNGLLYWGGHSAYDAGADRPCGMGIHELKESYPYYELMWEVSPQATKEFIEAFWSGHILDWSNLHMDRHCYNMDQPLRKPWDYEYKGGPVFIKSGTSSHLSTGIPLIHGAAALTILSKEEHSLVWAKRLAQRYVNTRHPKTGISYYLYTLHPVVMLDSYDDILRKLAGVDTDFPTTSFPIYSKINPIAIWCCRGLYMSTPEIALHPRVVLWQSLLMVGDLLDNKGWEFKQWSLEELSAFGRASYRKKDNVFVPILTDGTDLEGYIVKEDGPLGPKGVVLKPLFADPSDFWAYAMSYRVTKNDYMWEIARNIALGNGFGDIGVTPRDTTNLNTVTACSDPYAILAFLELNKATGKVEFIDIAIRIGDGILDDRLCKGFFVPSSKHIYSKFDAIDSLVLLHLYSTIVKENFIMPDVFPNVSFFEDKYREKDQIIDNQIIYTLTESVEPPYSLQEAAAIGNLDLVKSIVEKGTGVDAREDSFFKTALHPAAISGHKDVVEFLLSKGADVNAWDSFPRVTPLHYAAEKGNKEIVELLIAHGADVYAKSGSSVYETPLYTALRYDHKDIAELLVSKGVDVNATDNRGDTALHRAVENNREDLVASLIDIGADMNVRNDIDEAPLYTAMRRRRKDIAELLINKGADVNLTDNAGNTLLHRAVQNGQRDIVEFFIDKGANINAKNNKDQTPLDIAFMQGRRNIVELLAAKGAEGSSIFLAAAIGDLAKIKKFLEEGIDVKIKDVRNNSALHYAVREGFKDIAEFLLDRGASVDSKDNALRAPLYYAIRNRDKDMIKLLVSHGADVNLRGRCTDLPCLNSLVLINDKGLVELFVTHGADINIQDNRGKTALSLAKENGYTEIVELLRKYGAKEEGEEKAPENVPAPKEDKETDPNGVVLKEPDSASCSGRVGGLRRSLVLSAHF